MFHRSILAVAALALSAAPAQAALVTATWSGSQFGNTATATGHFDISPTISSDFAIAPFSADFHLIDLTISGATSGNGTFSESDFTGFVFAFDSPLDFSHELVGQMMSNGCTFGNFVNPCYDGASGDFNLFSGTAGSPTGVWYFQLNTLLGAGDALALTSIAPSSVAGVPEPTTWAMMLFGFGAVGYSMRRRKAAISQLT